MNSSVTFYFALAVLFLIAGVPQVLAKASFHKVTYSHPDSWNTQFCEEF